MVNLVFLGAFNRHHHHALNALRGSHVVAKPCQLPMSDPETLWELSFFICGKDKVYFSRYHKILFASMHERIKRVRQNTA